MIESSPEWGRLYHPKRLKLIVLIFEQGLYFFTVDNSSFLFKFPMLNNIFDCFDDQHENGDNARTDEAET